MAEGPTVPELAPPVMRLTSNELIEKQFSALTTPLRSINNRYENEILSPHLAEIKKTGLSNEGKKNIKPKLESWFQGDDENSFTGYQKTVSLLQKDLPSLPSINRGNNILFKMREDVTTSAHQILLDLGEEEDQTAEDSSSLTLPLLEWPHHIIERTARRISNEPHNDYFKPSAVGDYLTSILNKIYHHKGTIQFNIAPSLTMYGDKLFFEETMSDLIQTLSELKANNIQVDANDQDGKMVLTVKTDTVVLPDHFIQSTTYTDPRGEHITTQEAFNPNQKSLPALGSNQTRLSLAQSTITDYFKGTIQAVNNPAEKTSSFHIAMPSVNPPASPNEYIDTFVT